MSIYQYALSNRLTDAALKQLLELIRIHCPPSSSCPPSLYMLKKKLGGQDDLKVQYAWRKYLLVPNNAQSENVGARIVRFVTSAFFRLKIVFETYSQVGNLHTHILFHTNIISLRKYRELQYPFTQESKPDTIQDIQDGAKYKKPGEFLSLPEHTGLVLCSDGVPLFKSSG